ncbi:Las1-domain-containing protein [Metschnikowia bicuspidata]|uniref:Las1-domain-containing protein n=1 Tax=Metschnikowia bicuspidata TaxID=27322 RepID=A0A4P9ZGI1_9ASCO|nr:Las1-domain-containing protein [Metschnikowia bicuspidata]
MSGLPEITAFKHHRDILELRDLFYSTDRAQLRRAVALTRFWAAREKIPHGINSTSMLVAAQLRDQGKAHGSVYASQSCPVASSGERDASKAPDESPSATEASRSGSDAHMVLRAAYSMVLVRFVNGLLDPFQQGTYAAPLADIAKKIDLPYAFVEVRHSATHNTLPSLEMLREVADWALRWLWENYWLKIEPGSSVNASVEAKPVSRSSEVPLRHVYDLLKEYRVLEKRGSASSSGAMAELVFIAESPVNAPKLVSLLMRHWEKLGLFTTARRMYDGLIGMLPAAFLYQIVLALVAYEASKAPHGFDALYEWADYLVGKLRGGPFTFMHFLIFESADDVMTSLHCHCRLLKPDSRLARVIKQVPGRKVFSRPALLDELLLDTELPVPVAARAAVEEGAGQKRGAISVLGYHEFWKPTPFGVVP